MVIDGKMCQKLFNLLRPHLFRMAHIVKVNEAFHPINIPPLEGVRGRLLGSLTVVFQTEHIPHLIEQFGALMAGRF